MIKIYIARHGQTESNTRNACIGHKDVLLNELGEVQAQKLADRLSEVKFNAIYTSPLLRAVNTVMPVVKQNRDVKLTMNYGLIERDFGLWDDMSSLEIQGKYPDEYKKFCETRYAYAPPEGESVFDLQARASQTLDKIISAHENDTILIMTHGAVGRTILAHLTGLTPEQSSCFYLDNARFALIEYTNGYGVLKGLNI